MTSPRIKTVKFTANSSHFYTFFISTTPTFTTSFQPKNYSATNDKHRGRWIVSAGVITGIVLVFVLLGYLVYALVNAEDF